MQPDYFEEAQHEVQREQEGQIEPPQARMQELPGQRGEDGGEDAEPAGPPPGLQPAAREARHYAAPSQEERCAGARALRSSVQVLRFLGQSA